MPAHDGGAEINGYSLKYREYKNEAGIGRPSEPSRAAVIRAEVGPPSELTIVDMLSNSVVLSWQPASNDDESKISQYVVERKHMSNGR